MLKVSIIMPIYNAEQYLHRAINSILSQTINDWELILIDDGSTDSSSSICEQYAIQDKRIKVIHKMNEGVAMARDAGIKLAQGEYSIHVDSDDWIEPTMLKELYNKAQIDNADIVITDYYINSNHKQYISKQTPTSLDSNSILIEILQGRLFGALWNKLIRTSLYNTYTLQFFSKINYREDVLICAQILQHTNINISYLNKAFYHYFINQDSITHKITRKTYQNQICFQKKLDEILIDKRYQEAKNFSALVIFTEGFINNCLTKQEIAHEFKKNESTAFHYSKGIRWRLGYFLIKIGYYKLAHTLLKY